MILRLRDPERWNGRCYIELMKDGGSCSSMQPKYGRVFCHRNTRAKERKIPKRMSLSTS